MAAYSQSNTSATLGGTRQVASIVEDVQREQDIYELAIDIARQIFPIPNLLLKYKITEAELTELHKNPVFTEIIKQATTEWNAAGNTHKRTKLKAAILVESTLGTLYDSMTNRSESLSDRVKALDTVARIAGLNSNEGSGGPIGSTFKLSINLAAAGSGDNNLTLEMGIQDVDTPGVTDEQQEETEIKETPQSEPLSPLELLPLASRFAGVAPEDI